MEYQKEWKNCHQDDVYSPLQSLRYVDSTCNLLMVMLMLHEKAAQKRKKQVYISCISKETIESQLSSPQTECKDLSPRIENHALDICSSEPSSSLQGGLTAVEPSFWISEASSEVDLCRMAMRSALLPAAHCVENFLNTIVTTRSTAEAMSDDLGSQHLQRILTSKSRSSYVFATALNGLPLHVTTSERLCAHTGL